MKAVDWAKAPMVKEMLAKKMEMFVFIMMLPVEKRQESIRIAWPVVVGESRTGREGNLQVRNSKKAMGASRAEFLPTEIT